MAEQLDVLCPGVPGKLGRCCDVMGEFPKSVEFVFLKNVFGDFFMTFPVLGQSP